MAERMRENTDSKIASQIMNSPNYRKVFSGGTWYDVRVIQGERVGDLEIIFYPNTSIALGSIVEMGTEKWLLTYLSHDTTITKKGLLKRCNQTLKWKKDGIDYQIESHITSYYTLGAYDVEAKTDMDYDIAKGGLFAHIPINAISKTIVLGDAYVIEGYTYEVAGIDNVTNVLNGRGTIKLTLMRTMSDGKPVSDNTKNKLNQGGGLW